MSMCRGVASDGVYVCRTEAEVQHAFESLFGKPKYGGGVNDAILMQEFAEGPEFAVDTIAQDGHIKVVALWKYHKLAANGAPFVYQCSELISVNSDMEREVCQYCMDILKAQGLRWGPTHTEIKYTRTGPKLIEINARWHAQHFLPIVQACLGYDAVSTTLDTIFQPGNFQAIPEIPAALRGSGRILHLISFFEGKIASVNHVDRIKSLPSTALLNLELESGDDLVKTVDIRTDCGYVLQYHEDPAVVERDFDEIVRLQSTLFTLKSTDDTVDPEEKIVRAEYLAQGPPTSSDSHIISQLEWAKQLRGWLLCSECCAGSRWWEAWGMRFLLSPPFSYHSYSLEN